MSPRPKLRTNYLEALFTHVARTLKSLKVSHTGWYGHNNGVSYQPVTQQVGMAHGAISSLNTSIWHCLYTYKWTKIQIFKSLVSLVILYSCETRSLNSGMERCLDAFGTKYLCRIMGSH